MSRLGRLYCMYGDFSTGYPLVHPIAAYRRMEDDLHYQFRLLILALEV